MTNYEKGRQYEYEVKSLLEKAGYTVTRAASSKGPWDLVAVKRTPKYTKQLWLVVLAQAKIRVNKEVKDAPVNQGLSGSDAGEGQGGPSPT